MSFSAQIKAKLSKCREDHKPVLLFNDNSENAFDRLDLVREVHEESGGDNKIVEFVENARETDCAKFIEKRSELLNKAYDDEHNKKTTLITGASRVGNPSLRRKSPIITNQIRVETENKVREYFKSTASTFYFDDCSSLTSKGVYDSLTQKKSLVLVPIPHNIPNEPPFKVDILEKLLFEYRGSIFLDNLSCDHHSKTAYTNYRFLGKIIEGRKLVSPITNIQHDVFFRWLVIYTTHKPGYFPKEFRKQFVEIPLDGGGKRQEGGEGKVKTKETTPFPTPQDSKWSDIEITFIDNEHVNIRVKDIVKSGVHYSQMSFKHKTAPKEIKLWETLRIFAIANGTITPQIIEKNRVRKLVSVDDVKRLRVKLKSYFGINDNPIPSYDKGKYTKKEDGGSEFIKGEGYKTSFIIKDESGVIKQKDEFIGNADTDSDF